MTRRRRLRAPANRSRPGSRPLTSAPARPRGRAADAQPEASEAQLRRAVVGGLAEPREATQPPGHGDQPPTSRRRPRNELAVAARPTAIANGHAANGNGNGGRQRERRRRQQRRPITLNLGATKVSFQTQADAPSCADCGSIMVRNGSCYKCLNCGSTSGCS